MTSNPTLDFKTLDPKLPYLGKFSQKPENDPFSITIGTQYKFDFKSSNGY